MHNTKQRGYAIRINKTQTSTSSFLIVYILLTIIIYIFLVSLLCFASSWFSWFAYFGDNLFSKYHSFHSLQSLLLQYFNLLCVVCRVCGFPQLQSFKFKLPFRRCGEKNTQMQHIENYTSRKLTFSKWRNCILKKAFKLSMLSYAEVALIIFSRREKLYEFSSSRYIFLTTFFSY